MHKSMHGAIGWSHQMDETRLAVSNGVGLWKEKRAVERQVRMEPKDPILPFGVYKRVLEVEERKENQAGQNSSRDGWPSEVLLRLLDKGRSTSCSVPPLPSPLLEGGRRIGVKDNDLMATIFSKFAF